MSRARDYQPTLDRAAGAAERAARKISRLQEKADDHHREMLRATAAARIANEEADALRDRITGLEQSVRDLRAVAREVRTERDQALQNWALAVKDVASLQERLRGKASPWRRLREWVREAMQRVEEA